MLKDVTGETGTLNRMEKLKDTMDNKTEQLKSNIGLYNQLKTDGADENQIKAAEGKVWPCIGRLKVLETNGKV